MSRTVIFLVVVAISFIAGSAANQFNIFPNKKTKVALGLEEEGLKKGELPPWTVKIQAAGGETDQLFTVKGQDKVFESKFLDDAITVKPGVFDPIEAELAVLPLMANHKDVFEGKRVLEIGTGSGMISLYAAQLGATKVVSTDINPLAIETITANAEALGHSDVIEPRLVTLEDISAYAVIEEGEKFDVIISNPPFALDLDASKNDALTDTGELGFSIVRGLKNHLESDGVVILLYNSLFYHNVMVKFAEHEGYVVRNHNPNGLYPWAAESLWNNYLDRLLEVEGMSGAFEFNFSEDESLRSIYLRNMALNPYEINYKPLLGGNQGWRFHSGFLVIDGPEREAPAAPKGWGNKASDSET